MKQRLCVIIAGPTVALMLWVGASIGGNPNHVENFATTQYKDALNTTAWWDTVSGELKLFPFPVLAGGYDTPDVAFGVAVSGDYAYVADRNSGLMVIDISDPTSPDSVGTYDTPHNARWVTIAGDYAYVADFYSGLQVVDISDPTAPAYAGSYNTPGSAFCVAVSGDYVYVADLNSGLQVLDISDPTSPDLVGTYDTPGDARGVAISGDYAYVADDLSGLQVIDISDPTTPSIAGSYNTPGSGRGVAVSGDYAYVADYYSLMVIDISDPTAPSFVGFYNAPGNAFSVAISGDYAYVADWGSGLQVIDISDPTAPSSIGACDTPGDAYGVAIAGDYAYVGDYSSGLQVVDIGDPTVPSYAGSYNTRGSAWKVTISGDYAYVADYDRGLQVIDISDPTSPDSAGSYDTFCAVDVVVSGDCAYVADRDYGLQVIDISDPTVPAYTAVYDTPGYANGVAISGDYAYVADDVSGLQVIDISDPTNPDSAGSYDTPGQAYGVAISGDYAYVADYGSDMLVLDISDPTMPSFAGSSFGSAVELAIAGDYLYTATLSAGLRIFDVSNPDAPSHAGIYNTPGIADGVAISGDYAYVADQNSGLQVFDISEPTAPAYTGSYNTPGTARGVVISGDYAYVGDSGSGLQVIQVFHRELYPDYNVGWSLAVDGSNDTIFGARLTTTQTDTVTWELSADGGTSWQGIVPGGSWSQLAVPGTDLVWRSTHVWEPLGVNPAVTQLEINWLVEAALVDSIVDVPDDQGGWVRAHFTRSGRDFTGEASLPIDDYGIWQRVNDTALIAILGEVSTSTDKEQAAREKPRLSGVPVIMYQDKTYVQSEPGLAAASFPPGTWEWVATVPAIQQDAYVARIPTAADSSGTGPNYAVFVITAHTTTPSIWYISEPDSGYSLDNIAPEAPTGFAVAYNTGSGNHLTWDTCPDDDFHYFCVYRSNDPDFEPTPGDLVHTTTATDWNDPEYDGWNVHYKISACDFVGNESDPTGPGTTTAVNEQVIPRSYALYQNVPNPFNPTTVIRYDVPAVGGEVTLRIYDVSGRVVRTLVDDIQTTGEKRVTWYGHNDGGNQVATGVYFYRMTAPGFDITKKMVLLR